MNARLLALLALALPAAAQIDPAPPADTTRLVFVHHSVGENWLADDDGGLGRALAASNYYVSDTNYGWGPDGIGDRTDLVDWPEWFLGPASERILAALLTEGERHSPYSRPLADPGGQNVVVLFKSCFPNSSLGGRADDGPSASPGMTVGGAKRVYIDLLDAFAARPERLFVAITAPPVSDPTDAARARAFNRWLVEEWLDGYEGANVAVFDLYNVLTAPENHHRVAGDRIEHVVASRRDTLYYPAGEGDDHPSTAGNRKATAEFVPLLNGAVNRWRATRPPDPGPGPDPGPETGPPAVAAGRTIDDLDWEGFADPDSSIAVSTEGGRLAIEVEVAAGGWATCVAFLERPVVPGRGTGLRLRLRADRAGLPYAVLAFTGRPDDRATYRCPLTAPPEAAEGWVEVVVPWHRLRRVEWEDGAGAPIDPRSLSGLGFGFDDGAAGRLAIDDLGWSIEEE